MIEPQLMKMNQKGYGSYCFVAPYDEYVEVNDYQYFFKCGEIK